MKPLIYLLILCLTFSPVQAHQATSCHASVAGITSVCEGVQDLTATQFQVGKGHKTIVFGGRGVRGWEAHDTHEHEAVRHYKGSGWFSRSSSSHFQSSQATSKGVRDETVRF